MKRLFFIMLMMCLTLVLGGCTEQSKLGAKLDPTQFFSDPVLIEMCRAAERGDVEGVKAAIEEKHEIAYQKNVESHKKAGIPTEGIERSTNTEFYDSKSHMSPLVWAMLEPEKDNYLRLKTLLEAGMDPNQGVGHPLRTLREAKMDPHLVFPRGGSLIHEILNVDKIGKCSDSAIHLAAATPRHGDELLRILLKHGGNPNQCTRNGSYVATTPIFCAIMLRNTDNTKVLIEAGADVNHQASSHGYPVTSAAIYDDYHQVLLLLESGADWHVEEKDFSGRKYGELVWDIIEEYASPPVPPKVPEVRDFMKKHGADFKELIYSEAMQEKLKDRYASGSTFDQAMKNIEAGLLEKESGD